VPTFRSDVLRLILGASAVLALRNLLRDVTLLSHPHQRRCNTCESRCADGDRQPIAPCLFTGDFTSCERCPRPSPDLTLSVEPTCHSQQPLFISNERTQPRPALSTSSSDLPRLHPVVPEKRPDETRAKQLHRVRSGDTGELRRHSGSGRFDECERRLGQLQR
jgi:hypothetical protein